MRRGSEVRASSSVRSELIGLANRVMWAFAIAQATWIASWIGSGLNAFSLYRSALALLNLPVALIGRLTPELGGVLDLFAFQSSGSSVPADLGTLSFLLAHLLRAIPVYVVLSYTPRLVSKMRRSGGRAK